MYSSEEHESPDGDDFSPYTAFLYRASENHGD